MELSDWFKGFEHGIAALAPTQREHFFAACGKNCVACGTLQVYKKLYDNAGGDMDAFFTHANDLPGVRCEIIEQGRVYDLCFRECTCSLYRQGYVSTPLLCECSRQSILYVLHTLWEGRAFDVRILGSILRGSPDCQMRIEVRPAAARTPAEENDASRIKKGFDRSKEGLEQTQQGFDISPSPSTSSDN